jgi:hypothetical protein
MTKKAAALYVKQDEMTFGPFDAIKIKELADTGKLTPSSLVSPNQEGPWVEANRVKGLFSGRTQMVVATEVVKPTVPQVALPSELTPSKSTVINSVAKASSQLGKVIDSGFSALSKFSADGQDSVAVQNLHERVRAICTTGEEILYLAIQSKPIANLSPDCVALTNKRFIILRTKFLGQVDLFDCLWKYCENVHIQENIFGATLTFKSTQGRIESIDYIPKEQARQVYRNAQEQEEAAHSTRRQMKIEELQAGADRTVINQAIGTGFQQSEEKVDVVAKLTQLKQLLDAGVITQSEFDAKKSEWLKMM